MKFVWIQERESKVDKVKLAAAVQRWQFELGVGAV